MDILDVCSKPLFSKDSRDFRQKDTLQVSLRQERRGLERVSVCLIAPEAPWCNRLGRTQEMALSVRRVLSRERPYRRVRHSAGPADTSEAQLLPLFDGPIKVPSTQLS